MPWHRWIQSTEARSTDQAPVPAVTAPEKAPKPYILAPDAPPLLPVTSLLETDFVHLVKLLDRYGKEPRNRVMTIEQIRSERIKFVPGRIDIRRAQELSLAASIVESPTMIVPNWQVMGSANPGDAYIKNFGTEERPIYRVLICGHAGRKRRAVTIFPREHFAEREVHPQLWP